MNMTRISLRFLATPVLALAISACGSSTPPKAPGSNPEDMTPAGHEAAAEQEQQAAEEHREQGEDETAVPGKTTEQGQKRYKHEQEAEKHEDFAGQHKDAADKAAQPE